LRLQEEERIADARISRLYYDVLQIVIANGDQARAKVFAESAFAVWVILEGEDYEDSSYENTVLHELDRDPRCADIVQSFLCLPTAKFMAFYIGGTLEQRLRICQIRDEINDDQVISVQRKHPKNTLSIDG